MEGFGDGSECAKSKSEIVQNLLDRLVDKTRSHIRELANRFSEMDMLSTLKKETAFEECYDSENAAKMVFAGVLRTITRDETAFDRLVTILQEEGFENLASELSQKALSVPIPATTTPPDTPEGAPPSSGRAKLKRGTSWHGYTSGGALPFPKSVGENGEPDSGIASRNQTGLLANLSTNSDPHFQERVQEHFAQPKLLSASLGTLVSSRIQPPSRSLNDTNEHNSSVPTSLHENPPSIATQTMQDVTNQEFVTPIQAQEPRSYNTEEHQAPVQVDASDSHPCSDVMILPEGERLLPESTSIDTSEDDLAEKLQNMRLELQQMKAEEMQTNAKNVELHDRCRELEEKVEKTSEDLRLQKEHTEQTLKEKDDAIKEWKQRYDEKADEVEMLRLEIAEKEREQDEMMHKYEDKIVQLNAEHKQTLDEHNKRIHSLQEELKETKQKKAEAEIELERAKQELCKAEVRRMQEEIKVKDAMHKLTIETLNLRVALSDTKKELAEERQAKSEREFCDHRRQSVQQLQDKDNKIEELQKTVQRLISQASSSSGKDSCED